MNEFFNCIYVAIHTPTSRLCLVKKNLLGSQVMFDEESVYLTCEIGPISDFELLEQYNEVENE